MNSTLKRIVIPLLFIVLLPIIGYSVFEITSLNDTEEVIQEIYVNQLDAILNSVNQYSDLVVSSWVNEINTNLQRKTGELNSFSKEDVNDLFLKNKSLSQIFILTNREEPDGVSVKRNDAAGQETIYTLIQNNSDKIDRLFRYLKADYRKVEPLNSEIEYRQFLAVLLNKDNKDVVAILELNTIVYIDEVLQPVILEAAGDEFAISCISRNDIHKFNFDDSIGEKEPDAKSSLWILPNYELGIILKGRTLKGLIAERTYTNLIILLLMNVIIIGGVFFIYRSIRKEIQLAQIKSDFVSNVSHELRTPLALISMFSETLEMGRVPNDEKRNEYYRIISQESNRLSRIVNSILSFSKIEAGKRIYNLAETDLNNLVQQVYNNYKFHLENRNFKFAYEPAVDLPTINIDKEAVSEAIINLLDNAAKYSADNKEILIRTRKLTNQVAVEVTDKGIGISKEDQAKIFDKFFRVSTGLVHDTKGTGLGLTIVKHVLDAHNAQMELESKVSEGSTFRMIFNSVNT